MPCAGWDIGRCSTRAGWTAVLEVQPTPDCRADVVATNPRTGRTRALEAQLAPLNQATALLRHQRYVNEFGDCTWTHTGNREWSNQIPSLQVDYDTHASVVGGVITELADLTPLPPTDLEEVVPEILGNRIVYVFNAGWGTYLTREAMAAGRALPPRQKRRITSAGATRFCQRMTVLGEPERALLAYGFVSGSEWRRSLAEAHDVFRRRGWRAVDERQWAALAAAGEHPRLKDAVIDDVALEAMQVAWN